MGHKSLNADKTESKKQLNEPKTVKEAKEPQAEKMNNSTGEKVPKLDDEWDSSSEEVESDPIALQQNLSPKKEDPSVETKKPVSEGASGKELRADQDMDWGSSTETESKEAGLSLPHEKDKKVL